MIGVVPSTKIMGYLYTFLHYDICDNDQFRYRVILYVVVLPRKGMLTSPKLNNRLYDTVGGK